MTSPDSRRRFTLFAPVQTGAAKIRFPSSGVTLEADKGYDAAGFVADLRLACVTPHVARKARHSAIDGRTTRHQSHALSHKHRKRIEEAFGWAKAIGGMAQTVYRGIERVRSRFILTMAANNLARLPRLLAE